MILRTRHFEFTFPRPTLVMGIVNVTPDSFSDGGRYFEPDQAVRHALELVDQGADLLDVGGESSRPGATPVSEAEELRRVLPVIEALAPKVTVPISIDTMKAGVARAAIAAGASLVNDVGAAHADTAMWEVVAELGVGYVCMHMQGWPATMQEKPVYADVVHDVGSFFSHRLKQMGDCGVSAEQVILDPGIGFGKGLEHNLQLVADLGQFGRFKRPLLLGVSRKSFLGQVTGAEVGNRLPAALACACLAMEAGAQLIRAHDVAETVQALRMAEILLARRT